MFIAIARFFLLMEHRAHFSHQGAHRSHALSMFPVLVVRYAYFSRKEEADMLAQYGEKHRRYIERTPRFVRGSSRELSAA